MLHNISLNRMNSYSEGKNELSIDMSQQNSVIRLAYLIAFHHNAGAHCVSPFWKVS